MAGEPDWDVVVIGAGIHGAGVAQAASAAGYRVLLLEQYDGPARGTSSRSSKLIHGGLRYLETGEFHLVYECLRERALLLRNAPQLVKMAPFHIPVYRDTSRRPWKIFLGLALYTLLSRRLFSMVPQSEWHRLDGLTTDGLDAVFNYQDAQTDDALLTQAVVESARQLGAQVAMNSRFECAGIDDNVCNIVYQHNNTATETRARCIVNTAGAWAHKVLQEITPVPKMRPIDLVQGSHIIIPGHVSHPYYLEAPQDRRAVFALPWKEHIMVGTTEMEYRGNPADVAPHESELQYLLDIYNHYFSKNMKIVDVIGAFAGLRVLPGGGGRAFSKSREVIISENDKGNPRVFTLYGGKLTSYRATAEKVIKKIRRVLPKRERIADTRKLKL